MALPDKIVIGRQYRFNYPKAFVTNPKCTAHAGQVVTVVRQHTDEEADQGDGMERMFLIRASDGWTGSAWASELGGVK